MPDPVEHPARALRAVSAHAREVLEADRFSNLDNLSREEIIGMDPARFRESHNALEKQLLDQKKEMLAKKKTSLGPDTRAALADVEKSLAAIQKARDNVRLKLEPLRNALMRGKDADALKTRGDALAIYQGRDLAAATPSGRDSEANLTRKKFGGFLGFGEHRDAATQLHRARIRLESNPFFNRDKVSALSQRDLDFATRYDVKKSQLAELDRLDAANNALNARQNSRVRNVLERIYHGVTGRNTQYGRRVENHKQLKAAIADARDTVTQTLPALKENADRLAPKPERSTAPTSFEGSRRSRDVELGDVREVHSPERELGVEMARLSEGPAAPAAPKPVELVDMGAAKRAAEEVSHAAENPAQVLLAYAAEVNKGLKKNPLLDFENLTREQIEGTDPRAFLESCQALEKDLGERRAALVKQKTTTLGPDSRKALAEVDAALARLKQVKSDVRLKFEPLHDMLQRQYPEERGAALARHGSAAEEVMTPQTPSGQESEANLTKGKFGGFLGWGRNRELATELNRALVRLDANPYFRRDQASDFSTRDLDYAHDSDVRESQLGELERLGKANDKLATKQRSRLRSAADWVYNKATGRRTDYGQRIANHEALQRRIADARDNINVTLPFLKRARARLDAAH